MQIFRMQKIHHPAKKILHTAIRTISPRQSARKKATPAYRRGCFCPSQQPHLRPLPYLTFISRMSMPG